MSLGSSAFGAGDVTEGLTWGFEPTAVTLQNEFFDIGKPVNGKMIDYVKQSAEKFAELTHGTVITPTDRTILSTYQGILEVKNSVGTWMFHNDHGALEVATPIITDDTFGMMDQVFETFKEMGLSPNYYSAGQGGGSGHIHVGRTLFDKNPKILRNLLVDLENRPYIQSVFEELGNDQSKSIRDFGAEAEFTKRLGAIDASLLAGKAITIEDIADAFIKSTSPAWKVMIAKILPKSLESIMFRNMEGRTSAINVVNLFTNRPPTIEFRAFRPPNTTLELKQRMTFLKRYLNWLANQEELIPFKDMSTVELKRMRAPAQAIEDWNKFLKDELKLDPADYQSEIDERFPILTHSSVKVEDGGYEFEVRPMHTIDHPLYEIRIVSEEKPDVEVSFLSQTRHPIFTEVKPGTWSASFASNEVVGAITVSAYDSKGRINRNITGNYDLWDQFLGQKNDGNFVPTYKPKATASGATGTNCDLLMLKKTVSP